MSHEDLPDAEYNNLDNPSLDFTVPEESVHVRNLKFVEAARQRELGVLDGTSRIRVQDFFATHSKQQLFVASESDF